VDAENRPGMVLPGNAGAPADVEALFVWKFGVYLLSNKRKDKTNFSDKINTFLMR